MEAKLPFSERTPGPVHIFPQSFAQQQLWLVDRLLASRPVYNVHSAWRLTGALDSEALRRALRTLVQRHEALRTRFGMDNGQPVQVIAAQADFQVEVEDLGRLSPAEREPVARRRAREEAARPFDLQRGPPIRARMLRLGDTEHWLLLTLHHIATDGWSSGVLRRELSLLYEAFGAGRPSPLAELPVQYADYAAWQREWVQGERLEEELSFWKQALANLPDLDLPTDRPRPAAASYRGGRFRFTLDTELTRRLKNLGRREGATLFMTLLAALQVLLYRYTGQEDFAVGVPIAGRTRPELEGLIGYFVSMLALRGDLSGEPSFREHLARVRERALAAFAHQQLPFAKLVEELAPRRDASRNPLFQVSFALQNTPPAALELPGLQVSPLDGIHGETAKFDLEFSAAEDRGEVAVVVHYATDLFDAATIERLAGHWQVLLSGIVADPEQRISRLPLLTAAERQRLTTGLNAVISCPKSPCVHRLFEEQAARRPDAVAVSCEGEQLGYSELNARANQLSHHLRSKGVGPETLVAVCLERGLDLVVALLGVLKAGGAYVPLDPQLPRERLAFMLDDARAPLLVTDSALLARLPEHATVVCLDRDAAAIAAQPVGDAVSGVQPSDLAYVIYTSGSTGAPKGVMVTHGNVARLFAATQAWFGFGERDVWTCFHSFAFDFSVWEIWGALIHGGRLVMVPHRVGRDPEQFHALLRRERVTVLNQTPSAFGQLIAADPAIGGPSGLALRWVIFGGEKLEVESLRPWLDRHGEETPRLANMYGITETTVHVTYRLIGRADLAAGRGSMIGERIPDLRLYVVDRHLQPVPIGVAGEIVVGGAGVARGYLNRPELTAERFVADPYVSDPDARLYRSGDLARRTADGDLQYLGRMDQQVKIRGFRVELGEIEAVLVRHPQVREAAVLLREDAPGEQRLVAYVVARGEGIARADLRAFLKHHLPDYMVPAGFVELPALPLTPNGKVDRKALPAPSAETVQRHSDSIAPRDNVERLLVKIWEDLLKQSPIGVQEDFFELGGHSLLAMRLMHRIELTFHRQLPLDTLWVRGATIDALAAVLRDRYQAEPNPEVIPIKTGARRPLFAMFTIAGRLFHYYELARQLHPDQAVYGLLARGVYDTQRPDHSIEAIAAHHIELMRKVQPAGPYLLAGYCAGGVLAFEVARQLWDAGEQVGLLAMLETYAPGRPIGKLMRLQLGAILQGESNFRELQELVYFAVLHSLKLDRLRDLRTVGEAHRWAHWSYRPKPLDTPIELFIAGEAAAGHAADRGWTRWARRGVHVHRMSGSHLGIVKLPVVAEVAAQLQACIDRATDGVSWSAAGSENEPAFAA